MVREFRAINSLARLHAGVVLQALSNKVSTKFKVFCQSERADQFLHACITYFFAFFAV
jgi:hypothetical protein